MRILNKGAIHFNHEKPEEIDIQKRDKNQVNSSSLKNG